MRADTVECDSNYDWRRDGWLAACSLTAILLVISALTPHAPGFDTFLRLFVFCLALVRAFAGFRKGGAWLPLSAAAIAIVFNPAKPPAMSAVAWTWCDLIAACWFAIVGAWQLLRSWHPQRGWAVAAVSLGALAVPAVAALDAPNRDALKAPNLNENLAEMNAVATSPSSAVGSNSAGGSAARAAARETENAPSTAAINAATHDQRQVSAAAGAAPRPVVNNEAEPPANAPLDNAPASDEPSNSEADANAD